MVRAIGLAILLTFSCRAALGEGSVVIQGVDAAAFPEIHVRLAFAGATMARAPVPADLRLHEDGTPVKEFQLAVDPEPLTIALVLDRSGSMEPAMDDLRQAARTFIDELPTNTRMELIAFSDKVDRVQSLTADRRALCEAVDKLRSHGATALYDAIGEGLEGLADSGPGRRVLIAFTDGRDQNATATAPQSRQTAKQVLLTARKHGLPLYLVGLGDQINEKLLQKMAEVTGGRFFHAPSRRELKEIYRDIARLLRASFMATYQTPRPARDGSRRAVALESLAKEFPGKAQGEYVAPSTPAPATPSIAGPAVERPSVRVIPPGALDPFSLRIFGADAVVVRGASSIDAYDSTRGRYADQKQASRSQPLFDIRSNGPVSLTGTGTIYGGVVARGALTMSGATDIKGNATVGGDVSISGTADIEGDLAAGGTLSSSGISGVKGKTTVQATVQVSPIAFPAIGLGDLAARNDNGRLVPQDFLDAQSPPNCRISGTSSARFGSGVYLFHDLLVSGTADLVADGPVLIMVTGKLLIHGANSLNKGGSPSNFLIYCTGTDPATISGTAAFHGGLYAPATTVRVSGAADFFGGLVAKVLELDGTGDVHLDLALSSTGVTASGTPARQIGTGPAPAPAPTSRPGTRGGVDGTIDAAVDAAEHARDAAHRAHEAAQDAAGNANDAAHDAHDAAVDAVDRARDAAHDARDALDAAKQAQDDAQDAARKALEQLPGR